MSTKEEELRKQFKEYKKKKDEFKKIRKNSTEVYLIPKEWFNEWKKYINKDYFTQTISKPPGSASKLSFKDYPTPKKINNRQLLIPIKDYFNDGSNNNQVLVPNINNLSKKLSKEMWIFFKSKYEGEPEIKREGFIDSRKKFIVKNDNIRLRLLFLPDKKKVIGSNRSFIENIFNSTNPIDYYISKNNSIFNAKKNIVTIENKRHIHYKNNSDVKDIQLWHISKDNFSEDNFKKTMFSCYCQTNEKNLFSVYLNSKLPYEVISLENYLQETFEKLASKDDKINHYKINNDDIIIIFDKSRGSYFEQNFRAHNKNEGRSSKSSSGQGLKRINLKKCPGCKFQKDLCVSCPCKKESYCSETCLVAMISSHIKVCEKGCVEEDELVKSEKSREGDVGLKNLVNTCFMNAALQCMSNCWELTNFFLRDKYKDQINLINPIGSHGKICRAYANVLKHLWFGSEKSYSPENFINIFNYFTQIFTGHQQQDTQEFLMFLIDNLHEDLNKVREKPVVTEKEKKNIPDITESEINWYQFKRRNQSIIVELFYGQYKSQIYCSNPKCSSEIRKFEPFCCLSLPILKEKSDQENVVCFFIFYDIKIKPLKIKLTLNPECTILTLRYKIAKLLNIHPFSFLVMKVRKDGVLDYFANFKQQLSSTGVNDQDNKKGYFLLQHNPEVFYNPEFNYDIKYDNTQYRKENFENLKEEIESNPKIDELLGKDYKKDEEKQPSVKQKSYYDSERQKINTDYNFGLSPDILLVLLFIFSEKLNKDIIFPRTLLLNKTLTCKEIHHLVYDFIKSVFDCESKLFEEVFPNIDKIKSKDSSVYFERTKHPYKLKVRSVKKNGYCCVCGKGDCSNCILPYTNDTLESIIEKYPKNEKGKNIDNTFFYNVNGKEHENVDFMLEICTAKEGKGVFDKLNDLVELDPNKENSIDRCFNLFMNLEELKGDNMYRCDKCRSNQGGKKKMEIIKCPHILVIHLKRFNKLKKSNVFVKFPISGLDISKYVNENFENFPMIYDLFAVSYHVGDCEFGHYYAIAKNVRDKKWYKYDDSTVESDVKQDKIVNKDAYVLFYRRRNLENFFDLESIYKLNFINFENFVEELPKDIEEINKVIEEEKKSNYK